jgi:hypothetical protein
MQVRGGRAYETAGSLRARGEDPVPIEQLMRDARLYLIGEGASEILTLFIAREVMDPHLKRAKDFLGTEGVQKVAEAARLGRYYAPWYARQAVARDGQPVPNVHDHTTLEHLRYVQHTSHRLARVLFRSMARYQASLERRQAVVARLARIGVDLFVVCASALYAPHVVGSTPLLRLAVADAKERIEGHFAGLAGNDDEAVTALGHDALAGAYEWLAAGTVGAP